MTIRTSSDNKSTILQVAGVDKLKINDTGVVEADYFKTPAGVLSPVGAFRNKIINGDFRKPLWQRGNSFAVTGQRYTADRWLVQTVGATGSNLEVNFSTMTPHVNVNNVMVGSMAVTLNKQFGTDASEYARVVQRVEDVTTLAGKVATLSLQFHSAVATDVSLEVLQYFGPSGSAAVSVGAKKFSVAQNTWTPLEWTVEIPAINDKVVDATGGYLQVAIWLSAGTNTSSQNDGLGPQPIGQRRIWNVQLEEGSYATSFDQRPVGLELMLCHRYCYVRQDPLYFWKNAIALGDSISASAVFEYPEMRVTPTISSGPGQNYTNLTTTYTSPQQTRWNATPTASGASAHILGPIIADAEL